jgi:hypothetical protein
MKKLTLLLASTVFIINIGTAQESRTDLREKALFGLKAGTNYSNVYDSQTESFHADPKFGLAAGAFFAIPIGKFLGVQPELLYSQKGFQATGISRGSTYQFTRTTSYIDVPVLFSLKPVKFLTIHAGPQYSYLLNQKDVFTYSSSSVEQEQDFKNDNIRKNTLCFIGGADINLGHLVLGARAGWDLQNNNGNGTSTTPRYKNVWYQATVGFRFYN